MSVTIADAHNDLLIELVHRAGEDRPFQRRWLPQLEAGHVGLQVLPVFAALQADAEAALRAALRQVAAFRRALRQCAGRVGPVETAPDLDALGSRIGLMLSLEGCEPLGHDPAFVDVFWELGVRMVGLTWNHANAFATGSAGPDSDGLTEGGRALVDRLAELGVIIDLAHASPATFREVLERAPSASVIVSHAGARAIVDTPRNIHDDQLRALAERGGLFCVMAHPFVVDPASPTIDRLIDHVDHAVRVMGIEHVGLGGDFTKQLDAAVGPPPVATSLLPAGAKLGDAIDGLEGPQHYGVLVEALRRRGYHGDRLQSILFGNLRRLLRSALPAG